MDQTLQDKDLNKNEKMQWELASFYENETKTDNKPWYSQIPIDSTSSVVWIRWRGIRTIQNNWWSIWWSLFEWSLQTWDFFYDPIDRKVKIYNRESKDFSSVPQWWLDLRSYMGGEYVMYLWQLYLALQASWILEVPWTPSWDWFRKPVITYWTILPLDNSNANFEFWISLWSPIPANVRTQAITYIWYQANDNYENLIWWEVTIPSTWYYFLNDNETRWPRPWFTWIASKISVFRWWLWVVLSDDYKYNSTITVTWTDSLAWPITATVDQWTIDISTTKNTRQWYLNKWELIKVEVFHNWTWNTIDINNDWLQVSRLF